MNVNKDINKENKRVPIDVLINNVNNGNISRPAYILNILREVDKIDITGISFKGYGSEDEDEEFAPCTYGGMVRKYYSKDGNNDFLLDLGRKVL